jgi:hypothetical protein
MAILDQTEANPIITTSNVPKGLLGKLKLGFKYLEASKLVVYR